MWEASSRLAQQRWTDDMDWQKEKRRERQDSLFHPRSKSPAGQLSPATYVELVCVLQRWETKLCSCMNICIHERGREKEKEGKWEREYVWLTWYAGWWGRSLDWPLKIPHLEITYGFCTDPTMFSHIFTHEEMSKISVEMLNFLWISGDFQSGSPDDYLRLKSFGLFC